VSAAKAWSWADYARCARKQAPRALPRSAPAPAAPTESAKMQRARLLLSMGLGLAIVLLAVRLEPDELATLTREGAR
jgi:hypothetical protein